MSDDFVVIISEANDRVVVSAPPPANVILASGEQGPPGLTSGWDGGSADAVYTVSQLFDGGNA
jgi:hypothetical protein